VNIFLGLALFVLLVAWFFTRTREAKRRPAKEKTISEIQTQVAAKSTPYHAVSIKLTGNSCSAAKEMCGRRFLSGAAPRLPLPGCTMLECKCRFVHHADRRAGSDRRSQFQGGIGLTGATGAYEKERRERPERRSKEDADDIF
jgi:hypothetical protein